MSALHVYNIDNRCFAEIHQVIPYFPHFNVVFPFNDSTNMFNFLLKSCSYSQDRINLNQTARILRMQMIPLCRRQVLHPQKKTVISPLVMCPALNPGDPGE